MADRRNRPGARSTGGGPTDEELLVRFVAGDREALGELVRRYERPLFSYLVRMLGQSAAAEDAFQEVCLRLVRGADTYDASRSVRPWLYAIATNVCRRQGARRKRRRAVPLDSPADEEGPGSALELRADIVSPVEVAERRELAQLVREAVEALTEHQQEVFVLYQYQGLKYVEIARAVGRPLGTVKSDMFYALRTLRRRLERYR